MLVVLVIVSAFSISSKVCPRQYAIEAVGIRLDGINCAAAPKTTALETLNG